MISEKINFRKATEKDVSVLLDLIRKIAVYENMLHMVKATEESLNESIFENNRAEVLLIENENEVIGYMLYFFNYSTFIGREGIYLEDLYIIEEFRGKGIGKKAFELLVQIAKENKCERVEWVCLDWNEPSLNFYNKIGAKKLNEWILHRLDKETINKINRYGI